jgi:hypothetical protein
MGCCSPFTAVTTGSAADPGRHVNFTSGMVLGVDDYRQEFAYHSARDKWIVRDFLGYGTLSGLAVSVEDNGGAGPRIRVTPGAAAAPSGQLICVGREQCGALNAWLAREEIQEELRKRSEAKPSDQDHLALNVSLTLCYVDCAVAEVPIPGEPCRSDENLMAPSRIADDYSLNFAWDPPPQAEVDAFPALDALWPVIDFTLGSNTAADFATALRRAEVQLQFALGVFPADGTPLPGDFDPISVSPVAAQRFHTALKTLWVTKLRPMVAAQRCGTDSLPANDCVLLAQLWFPVVNDSNKWVIDGGAKDVTLDESARPVLLSTAAHQTLFGTAVVADAPGETVAVMTTGGNISPKARIVVARSDTPIAVKLPNAVAATLAREFTIKAGGPGEVTVSTTGSNTIDGADKLVLGARGSVSVVSDGNGTWHITGLVK